MQSMVARVAVALLVVPLIDCTTNLGNSAFYQDQVIEMGWGSTLPAGCTSLTDYMEMDTVTACSTTTTSTTTLTTSTSTATTKTTTSTDSTTTISATTTTVTTSTSTKTTVTTTSTDSTTTITVTTTTRTTSTSTKTTLTTTTTNSPCTKCKLSPMTMSGNYEHSFAAGSTATFTADAGACFSTPSASPQLSCPSTNIDATNGGSAAGSTTGPKILCSVCGGYLSSWGVLSFGPNVLSSTAGAGAIDETVISKYKLYWAGTDYSKTTFIQDVAKLTSGVTTSCCDPSTYVVTISLSGVPSWAKGVMVIPVDLNNKEMTFGAHFAWPTTTTTTTTITTTITTTVTTTTTQAGLASDGLRALPHLMGMVAITAGAILATAM